MVLVVFVPLKSSYAYTPKLHIHFLSNHSSNASFSVVSFGVCDWFSVFARAIFLLIMLVSQWMECTRHRIVNETNSYAYKQTSKHKHTSYTYNFKWKFPQSSSSFKFNLLDRNGNSILNHFRWTHCAKGKLFNGLISKVRARIRKNVGTSSLAQMRCSEERKRANAFGIWSEHFSSL